MNLQRKHLAMAALLAAGLILNLIFRGSGSSAVQVVSPVDSPALLEQRLAKLRAIAATVPAKTTLLAGIDGELRSREKNVITAATASQAQARLLEVVRRVASSNKIEARGADFAAPSLLGESYGQVGVAITFESPIEAFVNFLADLSKEPELIAPAEIHLLAGNAKTKTVNVRMTLAGVVPRALIPEKKLGTVL